MKHAMHNSRLILYPLLTGSAMYIEGFRRGVGLPPHYSNWGMLILLPLLLLLRNGKKGASDA